MPWSIQDYPDSLKNFDKVERKKIIEIGNELLADGYKEDRAIPIAVSQGKDWYENASQSEIDEYSQKEIPKDSENQESENPRTELLDNDVEVYFENNKWAVKTVNAKQPVETFEEKDDALERSKDIAENKESNVISYSKDGKKINEEGPDSSVANDVEVYFEDNVWKAKTVSAEKPSKSFEKKEDALERAKEIAEENNSKLISYTKDGERQE